LTEIPIRQSACGIVFTLPEKEGEPQILLGTRTPKDPGRWYGKLQLGPAGRVHEPPIYRMLSNSKIKPIRFSFRMLYPLILKAADWRDSLIGKRDSLSGKTLLFLEKKTQMNKSELIAFANATSNLAKKMAITPERPENSLRRESEEEIGLSLGLGSKHVISVTPICRIPPRTVSREDPDYHVLANFFLIRLTPSGANEVIRLGGSSEFRDLRLVPLSVVEEMPSDRFQPHYSKVIPLIRKYIAGITRG